MNEKAGIRQERLSDNIWLVHVNGRLDHTLTPDLEKNLTTLLNNGHINLIVDLSQASYINSGGLRCLVTAWRTTRRQQGNLVLCGLNSRLQETFVMVGFDKVFQIYSTCDMAQQAIVKHKTQ